MSLSWEDLSPLERDILYFIFEMRSVSFIDLLQRFPEQFPGKGKMVGYDKEGKKSFFWIGISEEFSRILKYFRKVQLIQMTPVSKKIYLHDTQLLEQNILESLKKENWIPIVYDTTDQGVELIRSLNLEFSKQLMAREIDFQLKMHSQNQSKNEKNSL